MHAVDEEARERSIDEHLPHACLPAISSTDSGDRPNRTHGPTSSSRPHIDERRRQASAPRRAARAACRHSYDDADVVVVNTCGFIDAAVEESLGAIGEALDENGRVIVAGCLGVKLRDACAARGVTGPIVPGILPIRDIDRAVDFAGKCGAVVPEALRARFRQAPDDAARKRLAVDQATELCRALVDEGVDELHFYTLNRAEPTREICANLCGEAASGAEGVDAAA